jgi:oxygen-independent coproporphyrinogen-3 oxidase
MDLVATESKLDWPDPRAVYLHVPFCRHRCGYCNFSVVAQRDHWIERFLLALDRELSALDRPEVQTVFLGGGTPTHLSEPQLEQLFQIVRHRLVLAQDVEWSIEANPEDITASKLDLLTDFGINRVSLGIQSFHGDKLRQLERSHDAALAMDAVSQVASRIPNVSIDLIFAAPGEKLAIWERDLEIALSLPIRHLSTYSLTFEKGTTFWNRRRRGDLQPIEESEEVAMYQRARTQTLCAGFEHYEISNFAAPGFQCAHNRAYWEGMGWFAAGPGAARFVGGVREVNHRSTATYLRRIELGQSPVSEHEPISREQYARERAAFGIRMIRGIDIAAWNQAVGVDLMSLCRQAISQSIDEGLLKPVDSRLQLTDRGILFADTVASRLLG